MGTNGPKKAKQKRKKAKSAKAKPDKRRKPGGQNPSSLPTIEFDEEQPLKEFYDAIAEELIGRNQFYRYGGKLARIRDNKMDPLDKPEKLTQCVHEIVEIEHVRPRGDPKYILLPPSHARRLCLGQDFLEKFPEITFFSERPVYTIDFELARPGYNQGNGIYYAGPEIQPQSVPQHIEELLGEVSWRDDADCHNYIGMMLATLFLPWYPGDKPAVLFNANMPGVGKTTMARILAMLTGDRDCKSLTYNPSEDEFEKRIGAAIRKGGNSILIDNAKGKGGKSIESASLERTLTDPVVSFRMVGTSGVIERPNTILWMITANDARLSRDLRSRCVPVNLNFVGDISQRKSKIGDLREYYREHEQEITAELMGMVELAKKKKMLKADIDFRFRPWAAMINGILQVNGFKQFLENQHVAGEEDDDNLDCMRDLASTGLEVMKKPGEWLRTIQRQRLFPDVLKGSPSKAGRATRLGKIFTAYTGRVFKAEIDGEKVKVKLVSDEDRKGKMYGFERVLSDAADEAPAAEGDGQAGSASAEKSSDSPQETANADGVERAELDQASKSLDDVKTATKTSIKVPSGGDGEKGSAGSASSAETVAGH